MSQTGFVQAILCVAVLLFSGCLVDVLETGEEVSVRVLVTQDMGTHVLLDEHVVTSSANVMGMLQEVADVETAYGGGFVRAIDGLRSGHPHEPVDWFYHQNGRLAAVGATYQRVSDGDVIVWDHRPWEQTMTLPWLLTGLDQWPEASSVLGLQEFQEEAKGPHVFVRVDDDRLIVLDAWGREALQVDPPWAVAHVIGERNGARLLLGASDEDASTSLVSSLDRLEPQGLGVVVTANTTLPIPAPVRTDADETAEAAS